MSGRPPKDKGAKFERELAAWFSEKLNRDVSRAYFTSDPIEHNGAADLIGLPRLAMEAKRHERAAWNEWMAQAVRNARDGEMPVVVNRRNRQKTHDSMVMLSLEDFTRLYLSWLRQEGFA